MREHHFAPGEVVARAVVSVVRRPRASLRRMSRRPIWQTLHDRFDPAQPVENAVWRADRVRSPAVAISRALDRPFGVPKVLFTGTIGTGKTTELLRIAGERASKEFVVYLSLERHFQEVVGDPAALHNVSAWEVCFLAGVALLRAARERLGFDLPEAHVKDLEDAWRAAAKAADATRAEPQLDVAKLGKSMVLMASAGAAAIAGPAGVAAATGLHVLEAVADAGRWSLPFGIKKRALPDQDTQVQTLLACVNVLIGLIQQRGTRVLLIIDGLDRIQDFEKARELFIESSMIGSLSCRLVLCGPYVLRYNGAINAVRGFSDVPPLVEEPVLDKADPTKPGPGVAFLRDVFARRVADVRGPPLVGDRELGKLAYYSGGRAREFVTLIRAAVTRAWDADAERVDEAIVDDAIDERRRRRETGLHVGHEKIMAAIAADPEHRLPADPLAHDLVAYGAVLPYPDGSEWYYPHPLLMIRFVRKQAG